MKITVFNGSPKGAGGNTHIMVEEFSAGARAAGAEITNVFLAGKTIKHCRGCFSCWIKTPGRCVIDDEMKELLPLIPASDIVVFATPLYVDNVTGLMKNFMDRLIPLLDPHFESDESGECRHILNFKPPKIAVISNCGFPEQTHFQVISLLFKRIARNMHSEVVAEIYRGGGGLLGNTSLILKPFIWKYKRKLQRAGKEIGEDGRLSAETRMELEKPIIPDKYYIDGANKNWDKALAKLKKTAD